MAERTDYNGWKNRATWNVMLWLDNEESAYRYYVDAVKRFQERKPYATRLPAGCAKAIAKNALGDTTGDNISLNTKCIDWRSIADAMWPES